MKVVLLLTRSKPDNSDALQVFLPCLYGEEGPTLNGISITLRKGAQKAAELAIEFAWLSLGVTIAKKDLKPLGHYQGKWVVYTASATAQQPQDCNMVDDWDGWIELQAVFDARFDPDIFPFIRMLEKGDY